jgi:hypothetical protein
MYSEEPSTGRLRNTGLFGREIRPVLLAEMILSRVGRLQKWVRM